MVQRVVLLGRYLPEELHELLRKNVYAFDRAALQNRVFYRRFQDVHDLKQQRVMNSSVFEIRVLDANLLVAFLERFEFPENVHFRTIERRLTGLFHSVLRFLEALVVF